MLDEPTSGLHLADVEQLLGLLDRLVDSGKSVIVIEHHQAVMAHADWIIDLGPGAGHDGGRIVFEGTPADLVAKRATLTGRHLARLRRQVTEALAPRALKPAQERRNLPAMLQASQQPLLPSAPRAEVFSVAELIEDLLAGRIRIPDFQRGWKWKRIQILNLLDSLYRGYPVGSLLFWQRPRPAERLRLGPREIVAPERSDARAVIDGQQRLTSLFGTLKHPDPRPNPDDDFVAFFDAQGDRFSASPSRQELLPESWVPVAHMLDAAELQDWLLERPFFQEHKDLRRKVLKQPSDCVRRAYLLISSKRKMNGFRGNLQPLQSRRHADGRGRCFQLAHRAPTKPGKIEDLAQEVAALGMGKDELRRHKLLQCVMAVAGLDVTRRLDDQRRANDLDEALEATAPALRSALAFLGSEVRIKHLRLLPYPFPLIVLCRYFSFFPEPSSRSRLLLVRWVWRGMMTGKHEHHERAELRASVQAVRAGEEELSVQRLLELVPRNAPPVPWWLQSRFDGRSAASRIAGLWLASLVPRHLDTGEKIEVKDLFDQYGWMPFERCRKSDKNMDRQALRQPAAFSTRRVFARSG